MLTMYAEENLEFIDEGLGYNYDYEFPYLHNHDYWEFVYTKRTIKHVINGESILVEPNSVFIVKPSDYHSIAATPSTSNPDKKPTHLNLKITRRKLNDLLSPYDGLTVEKMEDTSFPVIVLDNSEIGFWKKNINNILWTQDKAIQYLTIKMIINYIIIKNFDSIFADADATVTQIPDCIKKIATKLKSPAFFEYTIEEIVADINYSQMQLSRLFKKFFSMTMHDYFLAAKLAHAKNKLNLTDDSILSIAGEIGFSLSHFINLFQKHFGMSPGEFRRQNK